jgi:hypothetical protein
MIKLHSCCATSAGIERIFSVFGLLWTAKKLRNSAKQFFLGAPKFCWFLEIFFTISFQKIKCVHSTLQICHSSNLGGGHLDLKFSFKYAK